MNEKAKESAFGLLQFKDRTEKELRDRLMRKKYNEEEIDDVVLFLKDCGLLDDNRYAENYISNQISSGKGKIYIRQKLREKGVRESIIQEKMEALYDGIDEACVCLKRALSFLELDQLFEIDAEGNLALAAFSNGGEFPRVTEKEYARIFRRLINQGFPPEEIYSAIRKIKRIM